MHSVTWLGGKEAKAIIETTPRLTFDDGISSVDLVLGGSGQSWVSGVSERRRTDIVERSPWKAATCSLPPDFQPPHQTFAQATDGWEFALPKHKHKFLINMNHPDLAAHAEPSVHRLSYDDLHSIFTLCWTPGDNIFPVIASQVCRRWRCFILDMPVFWGHVCFHHKEPRRSMERYAAWIQRSKSVQLDISINNKPFTESPVENIEAIMELIGPHTERWRSLQIDPVSFQNIRMFLDHLKDCSLPQLELFRVVESNKGFHPNVPSQSLRQLALDAPQLREVELVGVVANFESPLFHNLHVLRLKDHSFAAFGIPEAKHLIHKLLQQSPRLERLSVRYPQVGLHLLRARSESPPPVNEDPFSHPSLLYLRLDFRDSVADIIPSIRLPALRSFRQGRKSGITLHSWHLPLLITSSPYPSLDKIHLIGNSFNREDDRPLVDALTTLPSLTWLALEYFDISQVTDAILALGYLCPQLRTLEITRCTQVDLNQVRALVDMRLAAHGVSNLQALTIKGVILPVSRATKAWFENRVERVILRADDGLV